MLTKPATTQAWSQGSGLIHANNHHNCELLEHVKELDLQMQRCRTSLTQGNNKVSQRSPSESPVRREQQKSAPADSTNQ